MSVNSTVASTRVATAGLSTPVRSSSTASSTVDESAAECAAVQRDARTARLLGAPGDRALALAVAYWRTVYPAMPDGYRSSSCRPGGAMDEHLPDAPWAPAGA